MSIAVLCNLSDGVIIGVDSAVTVSDTSGIKKVFEDGEKLFPLFGKIAVATYGLAGLEGRSIGSFLSEFEKINPEMQEQSIDNIVEALRAFFLGIYKRFAELIYAKPFGEIPDVEKGVLGLVVAGFSPGSFLSEAWEIKVPYNAEIASARQVCAPGQFGVFWFAAFDPIERYLLGFDRGFLMETAAYFEGILGRPLQQSEIDGFAPIRERYGYRIMTDSMPVKIGIEFVRFLVQLVIAHHRFTSAHPIVGGSAHLGLVTYKQQAFELLE